MSTRTTSRHVPLAGRTRPRTSRPDQSLEWPRAAAGALTSPDATTSARRVCQQVFVHAVRVSYRPWLRAAARRRPLRGGFMATRVAEMVQEESRAEELRPLAAELREVEAALAALRGVT